MAGVITSLSQNRFYSALFGYGEMSPFENYFNFVGLTRGSVCRRGMQGRKGNQTSRMIRQVHWRSVHPQTDHVTFRPTLFVHPTNCLLWHFTTMTFRLKVDGLSVHPKLWHSDLVNLDGLSQCDKTSHCNILSQSLWHFVSIFFVQLCYYYSNYLFVFIG